MSNVKIGILGGAFSPPTRGHMAIAQKVLNEGLVDQVWLSPCYSHNYGKEMTNPEHRVEMCKIACSKDPRITVSEFEIKTKLTGGTLKHITNLRAAFSVLNQCFDEAFNYHYEFYMIIGLDNANTFEKWTNYKKLIETVPFIVVSRKGVERDINVDWYMKDPHRFFKSVEIPETSSTEVREIIKNYNINGKTNNGARLMTLINPDVIKYIMEHNLYRGKDGKSM